MNRDAGAELLPPLGSWAVDAACKLADVDNFFPTGQKFQRLRMREAAQAVCASCPVRAECLDYARSNVLRVGVWGGVDFADPKLRRGMPRGPVPKLRSVPS